MCEADAFLLVEGKEKKVLQNVDEVDVEGDEIRMVNIFGEQRILKGRIKSYQNTRRKIILEAIR